MTGTACAFFWYRPMAPDGTTPPPWPVRRSSPVSRPILHGFSAPSASSSKAKPRTRRRLWWKPKKAAMLEKLKVNMERMSAINEQQSREEHHTERAKRSGEPVASIEERFDEAVAEAGLQDKRDALRLIVMPTVAMVECDAADGDITGLSRIGGGPDLPADMDWPRNDNGFHLNYLAQINLADLPDRPEELPESGLISYLRERTTRTGASSTCQRMQLSGPIRCRKTRWTRPSRHHK